MRAWLKRLAAGVGRVFGIYPATTYLEPLPQILYTALLYLGPCWVWYVAATGLVNGHVVLWNWYLLRPQFEWWSWNLFNPASLARGAYYTFVQVSYVRSPVYRTELILDLFEVYTVIFKAIAMLRAVFLALHLGRQWIRLGRMGAPGLQATTPAGQPDDTSPRLAHGGHRRSVGFVVAALLAGSVAGVVSIGLMMFAGSFAGPPLSAVVFPYSLSFGFGLMSAPVWVGAESLAFVTFGIVLIPVWGLLKGAAGASGALEHAIKRYDIDLHYQDDLLGKDLTLLLQRAGAEARPQIGLIRNKDVLNAFAIGTGGSYGTLIAISQSLVDILDDQERLAVLAHELGHVISRDVTRMTYARSFQEALVWILAFRRVRLAARWLFTWYSELGIMAMSRRREFWADAMGAVLVSPEAMAGALRKLAGHSSRSRLERNDARMMIRAPVGYLFSTHPPIPDRIAALDAGTYVRRLQVPPPVVVRRQAADDASPIPGLTSTAPVAAAALNPATAPRPDGVLDIALPAVRSAAVRLPILLVSSWRRVLGPLLRAVWSIPRVLARVLRHRVAVPLLVSALVFDVGARVAVANFPDWTRAHLPFLGNGPVVAVSRADAGAVAAPAPVASTPVAPVTRDIAAADAEAVEMKRELEASKGELATFRAGAYAQIAQLTADLASARETRPAVALAPVVPVTRDIAAPDTGKVTELSRELEASKDELATFRAGAYVQIARLTADLASARTAQPAQPATTPPPAVLVTRDIAPAPTPDLEAQKQQISADQGKLISDRRALDADRLRLAGEVADAAKARADITTQRSDLQAQQTQLEQRKQQLVAEWNTVIDQKPGNIFGAIAIDSNGIWWGGQNYNSLKSARQVASQRCEANTSAGSCQLLDVVSACVAVARSSNGAWGAAVATTRYNAGVDAVHRCETTPNMGCKVVPADVFCSSN